MTDPRRTLPELLAESGDIDVLLVNPESTYAVVGAPEIALDTCVADLSFGGDSHFPGDSDYEPNHGLLGLASMLRAEDISVDVLDLNTITFLMDSDDELESIVERWVSIRRPRVVGFSAMMPNLAIAKRWSKFIRLVAPDVPQLLGGLATEAPLNLLSDADFDVFCRGRANSQVVSAIRGFVDGGRPREPTVLAATSLLQLRSHERRDVADTAAAYDLLPRELPLIPRVFASIGCGAGCEFCSPAAALNYKVDLRTASEVGAEIAYLHDRYDFDCWLLGDLTLYLRSRAILTLLEDVLPDLDVRPWWCQTQVALASRKGFEALRRANCGHIAMGIEDLGAPAPSVKRKHRGYEQCVEAFGGAHEAGIATQAYWMFGLPADTFELSMNRIKQMTHFAREGLVDAMHISFLVPYPGTAYFDDAREHGLVIDNAGYDAFVGSSGGYYNCLPLHSTPFLSRQEIFMLTRLSVASVAVEYGRLRAIPGGTKRGILASA